MMKFKSEKSIQEFGYATDELKTLNGLVSAFSYKMTDKLITKSLEGKGGWDDEEWTIEDIKKALIEHIEKGDPIDVANFAAFWWNRLPNTNEHNEEQG